MSIEDFFKGVPVAVDKDGNTICVGDTVEDSNRYQGQVYYDLDRAAFMIRGSAADLMPTLCNEDFSKCRLIVSAKLIP